jgi:DNA-binding transcriptional regulator YdaS (Cro superfamily)
MSNPSATDELLNADAERAAAAIDVIAGDLVRELEAAVTRAVAGDRRAVVAYLSVWRRLEERVVDAVREAVPDLVLDVGDTGLLIEVKGRRRSSTWAEVLPLQAPFSPWAERFGRGRGTALTFVAYLRSHLSLGSPLVLPALEGDRNAEDEPDPKDLHRFLRVAVDELWREQSPLLRVAEQFELSLTELAGLFGVRRQAVSQWLEAGVPPGRAGKANAIARVADVLERNLKRERIPGVVRKPAEAYGGLNMLEMIERDRHEELVRLVEDAFDWATAA